MMGLQMLNTLLGDTLCFLMLLYGIVSMDDIDIQSRIMEEKHVRSQSSTAKIAGCHQLANMRSEKGIISSQRAI